MVEITKDQKIEITKDDPSLANVLVGLGWDASKTGGAKIDLDASAVILTNGKLSDSLNAVWFKNKKSADGSTFHSGDNRTGDGDGDDETISIDLTKVSGDQVDIVLTLFEAGKKGQSLANIDNAFIRLVNAADGKEILRYEVSGTDVTTPSLLFATFRKIDGNWSFTAEGKPVAEEIVDLLVNYGWDPSSLAAAA